MTVTLRFIPVRMVFIVNSIRVFHCSCGLFV